MVGMNYMPERSRMMGETAALNLDTYVFDANPDDRPAGLLHGVTPLTPTAGGMTGIDTIGNDVANLAAAMANGAVNPLSRGFQTLPFDVF
jgi:hypothetical protein